MEQKKLRHVVTYQLKETAEGNSKEENAKLAKEKLEALMGVVDGLLSIHVGIDVKKSSDNWDIVLISDFTDMDAYMNYRNHPAHKKVAEFMGKIRKARSSVDFIL